MGTLNGTAESYVFSIGRSAVTNGARLHVERPGGIATYGELTDRLGRCLQRLGLKNLKRQARDVTPSLGDILREGLKHDVG